MDLNIGRFEVVEPLAPGAGTLYLARDPDGGGNVAIRIYDVNLADPGHAERITSHLHAIARVRHSHLATIREVGTHEGRPFIAMDPPPGAPLSTVLARTPPLPLLERLALIEQVCAALAAVHAAGLTFGRLTTASCFVDRFGALTLVDFGVPPPHAGDQIAAQDSAHSLTPEGILGGPVDRRSDTFLAGCLLYEVIALRPPFPAGPEAAEGISAATFEPLSSLVPDVDPELSRIVERALARRPDDRYQNIDELRRDLERARTRGRRQTGAAPKTEMPSPQPAPAPAPAPAAGPPPEESAAPPHAAVPTPEFPDATGSVPLEELARQIGKGAKGPNDAVVVLSKDALPSAQRLDDVQFTVYRPKAMHPARPAPLLVFTHLVDARDPDTELPPVERARRRAVAILGPKASDFRSSTTDGRQAIPGGGAITLLPELPGVTFTPERHVFRWEQDLHEHRFEMTAAPHLDGQTVRGQLSAYLGAILLAEVPLAIRIDSTIDADREKDQESTKARPFRKIFASYSRRDVAIVEQFERYVEALGDRYLRDVRSLRAGERWEAGLQRLIDEADVFQLFWSWNAMRSPNVRREWEYALSLNRPAFVRPTYWETPLPESPAEGLPPPPLRELHFHRLSVSVDEKKDRAIVPPPGYPAPDVQAAPPQMPPARPVTEDVTEPVGLDDYDSEPEEPAQPPPALAGPAPAPSPAATPPPPVRFPPPDVQAAPRSSRPRVLRFAGIAAAVVLAATAGTLVLQYTGQREPAGQTGPPVPAEEPPIPLPPPPPDDRAVIEQLLERYVDALNERDEAGARAIDPAAKGFPDSTFSGSLAAGNVVIEVAPDGQSATLQANLTSTGQGSSNPSTQPRELRWTLRKAGNEWRVAR